MARNWRGCTSWMKRREVMNKYFQAASDDLRQPEKPCFNIRTCIHYFHRHLLCPKNVATALEMRARCLTLLRFLSCIHAFMSSNLPMQIVNTGSYFWKPIMVNFYQKLDIKPHAASAHIQSETFAKPPKTPQIPPPHHDQLLLPNRPKPHQPISRPLPPTQNHPPTRLASH